MEHLSGKDYHKDDPECDGTDSAHPAYWRGHDAGCHGTAYTFEKIVDGQCKEGVMAQPLQRVKEKILALIARAEKAEAAGAEMRSILTKAQWVAWREYDGGLHFELNASPEEIEHALSTDCGRDYTHGSELDKVQQSAMADVVRERDKAIVAEKARAEMRRTLELVKECWVDDAWPACERIINKALSTDAGRDYVPRSELDAAKSELADLNATFDLRCKADLRAIKLWQAESPGRDMTWPDHADLVVWLGTQLDAAKAEAEQAKRDRNLEGVRVRSQFMTKLQEMQDENAKLREALRALLNWWNNGDTMMVKDLEAVITSAKSALGKDGQ